MLAHNHRLRAEAVLDLLVAAYGVPQIVRLVEQARFMELVARVIQLIVPAQPPLVPEPLVLSP